MIKQLATATVIAASALSSSAATVLNEGFDSFAAALAAGWVAVDRTSSANGLFEWEQGNGELSSQSGAPTSYAQARYYLSDLPGPVDSWLLTPVLAFDTSNTLTFFTRTLSNPAPFADRLEVLLSTAGSSTAASSFTTSLVTVNPNLSITGYPADWTAYSVTFAASTGSTGRVAFRVTLPDNVNYGDVVGLDTVSVSAVPEAPTALMALLGTGAVVALRRRRRA